mgnify:CR=1 FL=1
MIECSEENIYYKKRRKKPFGRFFSLFLTLIILLGIFLYFKYVITDQIIKICRSYAYSYSTESVNDAVINSLADKVKYSDLITIDKNSAGEIVFISTDSFKINDINRDVTDKTEKALKKRLNNGVPIPLLAFTGIDIISGYGLKINYKSISISSVKCGFESTFSSVGINQTLHSIYLSVDCVVDVMFPLSNSQEKCSVKVLISESVIVGKVPEIYLNGKIFG